VILQRHVSPDPFELVLITSPEDFADEHTLIESLFGLGLFRLHVRKPHHASGALERWLLALNAEVRSCVVLHGHPEMAREFNLCGYHMNVKWFTENPARFADSGLSCSASAHSMAEVDSLPEEISYVFLSPVFDSISKVDYHSAFDLGKVATWLASRRESGRKMPVFALGGVDADTISLVKGAGFDGAAVLGGVWNYANPLQAWRNIYDHL
jgi:thiamine-phosphate pyrophosphorylase